MTELPEASVEATKPAAASISDPHDPPEANQQEAAANTMREQPDGTTPAVDEEGLRLHYDVILCGTGLVQAILASALARAGRAVLHVDGNDYYGGLEAAWTLPYLTMQSNHDGSDPQLHREFRSDTLDDRYTYGDEEEDDATVLLPLHREGSNHSLRFRSIQRHSFPVSNGSHVQTAYGRGRVLALEPTKEDDTAALHYRLTIELTAWKLADGSYPKVHVGVPASRVSVSTPSNDGNNETTTTTIPCHEHDYLYQHHQIRTVPAEIAARALDQQARSFALDVTPYLLYCTGPAVAGLLTSSVAEYCEFKSLEGLLYMGGGAAAADARSLSRVPCSKNDVFASQLLSPMDKRRLMKFLQTALDYATAEALQQEADAVAAAATEAPVDDKNNAAQLESWNERHLNQGRSLARPQNKAVAGSDLQQLQELCRRSRSSSLDDTSSESSSSLSFETYLREHQKLSPSLSALVRYALALETGDDDESSSSSSSSSSTADGMKQLCAHMLALGRYGGTAFLVPMYGSGEIPQAFCRSAAVYGATYLLRRAPLGIVVRNSSDSSSKGSSDNSNRAVVEGIVLHGPAMEEPPDESESGTNTKQIKCRHVVVPDGALQHRTKTGQRVMRRISILAGKPLLSDDSLQPQQQRHLMILPPGTVPHQTSTIHGLLLDESVHVAPHVFPALGGVGGGCSVLHLTTTTADAAAVADSDDSIQEAVDGGVILEEALNAILDCSRRQYQKAGGDLSSTVVEEIFHVTFSYDLYNDNDAATHGDASTYNASGLHVVHRPRPGVAADAAFEQAALIFAKICPGQEFLKLSQAVDAAVKETLGDAAEEEDEENLVLESAVGMISEPTTQSSIPVTKTEGNTMED